jgi:hypothetical protein
MGNPTPGKGVGGDILWVELAIRFYNRYAAALWAAENEHKYFISFTSQIAFCTANHFYFCLAWAKLMKLLRHCFNNQLSFLLGNPLHLSAIQHSYVQ